MNPFAYFVALVLFNAIFALDSNTQVELVEVFRIPTDANKGFRFFRIGALGYLASANYKLSQVFSLEGGHFLSLIHI